MKKMSAFLILALASALASAQDLVIELSWDMFDENDYEGALILPHKRGQDEEIVRAMLAQSSRDGTVRTEAGREGTSKKIHRWTVSKAKPGRYRFYVAEYLRKLDFQWNTGVSVSVKFRGQTASFIPPDKKGALWQVFDIVAEDSSIIEVNAVLPRMLVVYGYALNAVTGEPMKDAKASLTMGGQVIDSALINPKGQFVLLAQQGSGTVKIEREGFIPYTENIRFFINEHPIRIDAHLSSTMTESQYRAILSWGQAPRDLDEHLVGPTPGGGEFHISYRNMRSYERRHFLDKDCVSGFGPETITIEKLDRGIYSFCVQDYSNLSSRNSSALSYSDAVVRLYREDELLAEYQVPEGMPGNVWRVFQINGSTGEIIPKNEMFFESSPDQVR